MKKITIIFVLLLLFIYLIVYPTIIRSQERMNTWEVYFSPRGGCTDTIIRELDRAKVSVLVQAYSFTSAPITKALLNAHKKGVEVKVILDKNQRTRQSFALLEFILNEGIAVC